MGATSSNTAFDYRIDPSLRLPYRLDITADLLTGKYRYSLHAGKPVRIDMLARLSDGLVAGAPIAVVGFQMFGIKDAGPLDYITALHEYIVDRTVSVLGPLASVCCGWCEGFFAVAPGWTASQLVVAVREVFSVPLPDGWVSPEWWGTDVPARRCHWMAWAVDCGPGDDTLAVLDRLARFEADTWEAIVAGRPKSASE